MGYDLRITRSTDWTRHASHEIDGSAWPAVVYDDPEPTPAPCHGASAVRCSSVFFDQLQGSMFTTDPDRAMVAKMSRIAELLQGVVQKDDGEFCETARQWTAHGGDARTGRSPREIP